MKLYLLRLIGLGDAGEASEVVGIFDSRQTAAIKMREMIDYYAEYQDTDLNVSNFDIETYVLNQVGF